MKNRKFRKLFAGISSLCVLAAALPSIPAANVSAAAEEVKYGDADLDGSITVNDVVSIMCYAASADANPMTDEQLNASDVYQRGDGVNTSDAISIQKYLAKQIASLPESYKEGDVEPVANEGYIHLLTDSITTEGDYLTVEGKTVTIGASGVYYVDGNLADGQIIVETPADDIGEVEIVLNDVTMTGSSAPCIYSTALSGSDKTKITVNGTNTLTDTAAAAYTESGVIFTNNKLTITKNSTGTLNINSTMNAGINSEKKISLNGGTIVVNTDDLTTDAVLAGDADAIKSDKDIEIEGASIQIKSSADGIKSDGSIYMISGTADVKAGNDAVQAALEINVSGGTLTACGDRGLRLDANGLLNITGGTVIATATDYQVNGNELISTDGTTQTTVLLDMAAEWTKDNAITIGSLTYSPIKKYDYVLISDASLSADGSYSVYVGGQQVGHGTDKNANFLNTGAVTQYQNVDILSGGEVITPGTGDNVVVSVNFSDSGVTLANAAGEAVDINSAENMTVSGTTVTVTKSGDYSFSGNCSNGQIVVNTDDTAEPAAYVTLSLNGLTLSNSSVAPIYVENVGDECAISAKDGTVNTISDGTSHTDTYVNSDNETITVNAPIFARDDLKLKGKGTLIVNGNTEDGIVCKNDLKIWNGTINVTAVDDAIRGNDSVRIGDAADTDFSTLNVTVKTTTSGDGIKATSTETGKGFVLINGGTIDINAYADGIQAEQDFTMNGGSLNIYTYQGSGFTGSASGGSTGGWGGPGGGMDGNSNKVDISAKGIKSVGLYDETGTTYQSGGNITINGGSITIDSSDDCIHCGGNMNILGGAMNLATADDACHSDNDFTLGKEGGANSDFEIYVTKCYEGIEGNNIYQYSGTVVVKAGDDGYNAAGGADGSGNSSPGGWNPGGGFGTSGGNQLTIAGGIAIVQSASGDHDAFDSNGPLNISGGCVIANGQEPLDCGDGYSESLTGGTIAEISSQSTGTVSANTLFTIADASGNVVVSFTTMQGMGNITLNNTNLKCYTGGTISGGTDLITSDSSQSVYANGTISGGTAVSTSGSNGNQNPWG